MFDTFYDDVRREQIEADVYGGYNEEDPETTFECEICGKHFHPGEGGYKFIDCIVCEDCLWDYVKEQAHDEDGREFILKDEETEEEFLLEWFKGLGPYDKIALLRKAFNENELNEEQAIADFCLDSNGFTDFVIERNNGRRL